MTLTTDRIRKRNRREHELCFDCGMPSKQYYCKDCRQNRRKYLKEKLSNALDNNLCRKCFKKPRIEDHYYCEECRIKRNNQVKERAKKLKEKCLCFRCRKNKTLPSLLKKSIYSQFCEDCFFKKTASETMNSISFASLLRNKFYEQNETCPYSGAKLILGLNATVDHIIPVAKCPELKNDPNNVQWVSYEVNCAKWTMSHDEFVQFIKTVYLNLFNA